MTPDGRYVVFESVATDLVPGDVNLISDVFLRDTQSGVIYRVSEGSSATSGASRSEMPSISSDGTRVAFASTANIFGAKPNSAGEVYVRDLPGAATIWVSINVYRSSGPKSLSFNPIMDAAGRYVAFKTIFGADQANPIATNLYYHDLVTGTTTLLSSNVLEEGLPEMTLDGRFVAY